MWGKVLAIGDAHRDVAGVDVALLALKDHPGGIVWKDTGERSVTVMIKLSACLWPEHLKFHLEPMQLHIKVRKNKGGGGGGEGVGETYKVKHPGIDFCPCCRGAGHSLETDQAFFCINSGNDKHTHTELHNLYTNKNWSRLICVSDCQESKWRLGLTSVRVSTEKPPFDRWNNRKNAIQLKIKTYSSPAYKSTLKYPCAVLLLHAF